VGIATGDVIAGYTGTQQRATYTCVGPAVNLASRLEAHTKVAGRPILVDAATRQALGSRFEATDLGATDLKGIARPVELFSLEPGPRGRS
jgi:class 3 adenylate cyclase